MNLTEEELKVEGYEKVLKVTESRSGLEAIIAIHNTALGPALGGTRIYPYSNFDAALTDVLRLSKGMTYKSAVAEAGLGGGKSVIIADSQKQKSPQLLQAFGAAVEKLKGQYVCAEDVGCSPDDVAIIRKSTQYVVGLPHKRSSGNPSPYTAWGVFRGIQSTMQHLHGSDSLKGKKVAVQGIGHVGQCLLDTLFWVGAELYIYDIDKEKNLSFARRYGATPVSVEEIMTLECDVFAPCALGGILNKKTIPYLQCRAIAGAANNQLLHEEDAILLAKRGILYAPDFVINAGGLINVLCELDPKGYDANRSRQKVHQIYNQLLTIYAISQQNNFSTHEAAVALADYRLRYGVGKRRQKICFHHSA